MNRLDPELKRLLRRSRPATGEQTTEMPFGFSGRVVADWAGKRSEPKDPGRHRLFATVVWASCLVIAGCGLFLVQQSRTPRLASDFSTAAQFLANALAP